MYQKTRRIFFRNFLIFCLALILCAAALVFSLFQSNQTYDSTRYDIEYTAKILQETERFSDTLDDMISAYINYSVIKEDQYLDEFNTHANRISDNIDNLTILVSGDELQERRTQELKSNFIRFKDQLQTQSDDAQTQNYVDPQISDYAEILRARMLKIHSDILKEENQQLRSEIFEAQSQKDTYFRILIFGTISGAGLLVLLNLFLFTAQSGRLNIEEQFKVNEERFKLAIEGTNDGVFDWNLRTNKVFYSAQFFGMLGYEKDDITGTVEDFTKLLHPEDHDRVWEYTNRYLNGEIPEYISSFRMKHKNGNWTWIQSRAKAIYSDSGEAIRMVGAHSDITYLKEYQEFLKREKQHAEQANIAKSEFLAHMSHEIRTPLTAINGIAEIFEKNIETFDDKQKRLVKTLKNSTSSLKDLINDILDFSKIEEGEIRLENEPVELGQFLDQIYQLTSIQASEKGIGFEFDYQDVQDIKIYADPMRLRQILINLIGNAIKFTQDGSVKVIAREDTAGHTDMLKIEVKDTGIGIPKDKLDIIFERFKQSDDSISRSYGGTGLGLSISKKLVDMMGGTISVSSQENQGSTFTVKVPLLAAENEEQFDKLNITNIESRTEKESTEDIEEFNAYTSGDAPKSRGDSDKRILIVEDYEGNVVILSYILDQMELDFDVAENGRIALEKWEQNDYDLVLMDIQMPEMDGFTATRRMREAEKERKLDMTPIIGMTAHALIGDKEKCLEVGMNAYVPKPINENDLRAEIRRLINDAGV